jgi:hypothetical protein
MIVASRASRPRTARPAAGAVSASEMIQPRTLYTNTWPAFAIRKSRHGSPVWGVDVSDDV